MELVRTILVTVLMMSSFVMMLFILLQDSKGNAVVDAQASSIDGVTNPLRRATFGVAGIWMVSAICLGVLSAH